MGKELGFHRRNISKKGEKNCGSKLRLGTYIECTDLYRSHRARDQNYGNVSGVGMGWSWWWWQRWLGVVGGGVWLSV